MLIAKSISQKKKGFLALSQSWVSFFEMIAPWQKCRGAAGNSQHRAIAVKAQFAMLFCSL
jgi:hypothetical protein